MGHSIVQLVRVNVEVGNWGIPLVVVGMAREDQVNIVLPKQRFPDLAAVLANASLWFLPLTYQDLWQGE